MIADSIILELPHVSLNMRSLLPEYSGIYYVVDDNKMIWYIGQAKNINQRWKGKSHHRIYQLEAQKKQNFTIYYKPVNLTDLDSIEKQEIEKYSPYLNETTVKTRKIRSTETLLRETISAISDFAFIIGVETNQKEIYLNFDLEKLREIFEIASLEEEIALLKAIFTTRKKYANYWSGNFRLSGVNLLVYGYTIKVIPLKERDDFKKQNLGFKSLTLAKQPIHCLELTSLIYVKKIYNDFLFLQNLEVYQNDLIPIYFDDSIEVDKIKQNMKNISQDYKQGTRGIGSRSKTVNIDDLLMTREININKYGHKDRREVRIMRGNDRIGLYVQSFSVDAKTPRQFWKTKTASGEKKFPTYNSVWGQIDGELHNCASAKFDTVYLLASVDRKGWLLVEDYLQEFAQAATPLNNGEGYCEKWYVSAKKFLVPAKVNIKLVDLGYSVWIPFGCCDEFPTFDVAKNEIIKRLQDADLPSLKLSFTQEKITR